MAEASDLHGKVCMVTGASSGIGRAAAHGLARLGPELVLVCRSQERGEETVHEIQEASGNPRVSLLRCDLSSQSEIHRAADEFLASGRPLHVLLNNAGVFNLWTEDTVDGIEATFALNHLGYFLWTWLLLDRIRESAPARIVSTASSAHAWAGGRFDFDDVEARRAWNPGYRYASSKLANILFTRELARRLEGTGVTANCFCPGFVGSGFARNNGLLADLSMRLIAPFARTPEQGAETAIHLCASKEVEGTTGKFFMDSKEVWPKRWAQNDDDAARLWSVSERMTGV